MRLTGIALVATMLLAAALPAAAQSPVSIQFNDGRVTLIAKNAPLRTILAEWARVGGSTIRNAERVTGNPVTLELNNVPEREALRVLLRSLGGYMAAQRRVDMPGASSLDRIFLIPTPAPANTAATNVVTTPSVTTSRTGAAQTPFAQAPPPLFFPGDPDNDQDEIVLPNGQRRVINANTAAQQQQAVREAAAAAAAARAGQPVVVDDDERPQTQQPAPATTPGMPGGVIRGSARPGEITPPPPQPRNRANDEP